MTIRSSSSAPSVFDRVGDALRADEGDGSHSDEGDGPETAA
ncbi:hypothetical protein [Streptomyces rimosus]